MNFLSVDFAKGTTALFKEAFKFKKYKAMPLFFAIVIGICQIGFAIASFLVAGIIYVFNFIMKLFAFPIEQIHGIIRNEKNEVKAGAQTIIYLVSWPLIFFSYVSLIFSTFVLNILYIFLALFTYVWTLGGFKFHLLMSDAGNIEKNVEGRYNKTVLIAFVICIAAIAILLPLILVVLFYIKLPELDRIYLFKNAEFKILLESIIATTKAKATVAAPVLDLFIFIYTLVAFIPFPRAPKEAPAIAEAVAESAEAIEEAPVEEAPADEVVDVPAEEAPAEAEIPAEETPAEVEAEAPASAE